MKSYTDLDQSKKLAEFLSLESADMHYHYDFDFDELEFIPTITEEDDHFVLFPKDVRCWSIAALLELIPNPILTKNGDTWNCTSFDKEYHFKDETFADELIDAIYKMIIKLHELNLL